MQMLSISERLVNSRPGLRETATLMATSVTRGMEWTPLSVNFWAADSDNRIVEIPERVHIPISYSLLNSDEYQRRFSGRSVSRIVSTMRGHADNRFPKANSALARKGCDFIGLPASRSFLIVLEPSNPESLL